MARRLLLFTVLLMPVCAGAILGDLNRDGQVNFDDFFLLSDHFGEKGAPDPPDTVWVVRIDTLRQVVRDTVEVVRVDTLRQVVRDTVVVRSPFNMEFVWIDPGTFMMGSRITDLGLFDDEVPQHQVTISKGFYLGKYEITQWQWETVMGTQPWLGRENASGNPGSPAVHISWGDMQVFVQTLNVAAGDSLYRLPTEAEWEYACRAGTQTRYSFGDDESLLGNYAWDSDNTFDVGLYSAQPVGTKLPNPWRLYDMYGNVLEWVQDWYGPYSSVDQIDPLGPSTGSDHIARGGAFLLGARRTRSAARGNPLGENSRAELVGARLLRIK